jgi:hypothetical protein
MATFFGYFTYRHFAPANVAPLAVSNDVNPRSTQAKAGAIGRTAPAVARPPAEVDTNGVDTNVARTSEGAATLGAAGTHAEPARTAISRPEPVRAMRAPARQRRTSDQTVESQPAAATATAVIARPRTSAAEPCTEKVAALGLCTSVPIREAKAATDRPAAAARPEAADAGERCTAAVAALGLCTR